MSIFVILPDEARKDIYEIATSTRIQAKIHALPGDKLNQGEIACMLECLYENHDLWGCDDRSDSISRWQSFLAIKFALDFLNLVKHEHPSKNIEEWHIIDVAKKHGYSPWV
jgi:hypothetical protein